MDLSTSSPVAGDQGNGVKLGGAWRNFSERIRSLELENHRLLDQLAATAEDRDSLLVERADMSSRFHDSVASLTQEFSGHLRSLQIIETIRTEKLTMTEKADMLEELCAKLTGDIHEACNEIARLKQDSASWRSEAITKGALLEEEKVENRTLRDMMYKKDEQIEAQLIRMKDQDANIDTMKRAICTKDRQLVLLVKERDRYKQEIKANSKAKKVPGGDRDYLDAPPSPITKTGLCSPAKPSPKANVNTVSCWDDNAFSSPLLVALETSSSSFSKSMETSERQYKAIIRKLRADLEEARAAACSEGLSHNVNKAVKKSGRGSTSDGGFTSPR